MHWNRVTTLVICALIAVVLGACREEERDRPLSYTKGQYSGQTGASLNDMQLQQLRQRSKRQAGGGL